MKKISLLLALITVISCSHLQSGRSPSNSNTNQKPRHLVITVHGLSGNAETFGHFSEATTKYLNELNPKYEVQAMNFIYPTGRSEKKGSVEFALDKNGLGEFVKKQFADRPLHPEDKISFVSHSQGGLVTYLWYFNSILDQKEDFEYAKHVDSIITLGTPFWGSKIASVLTDPRYPDVIPFIKFFAPDNFKMTRREIADLAFGSDAINTFRQMAIEMDNNPSFADLVAQLPTRFVNITGVLPKEKADLFTSTTGSKNTTGPVRLISDTTKKIISFVYKVLTKSYSGNKRVESDIAVPVPSSRWNFIYATPKEIKGNTVVSSFEFQDFNNLVQRTKNIYTESAHLPFDTENTLSMAYVNKACLEVETCKHPTYRYIIEELANCENDADCNKTEMARIVEGMKAINKDQHKNFKDIQKSLQSFSIQINIRLKPGQIDEFPVENFRLKPTNLEGEYAGYERWQFNEYSLLGKALDLKTSKKNQISKASTDEYTIVLGDEDERHSVDIVSKSAAKSGEKFDVIRIHVTGRVEDRRTAAALATVPATGESTSESVQKTIRQLIKGYVVPVELKLPKLPVVQINARVQPTYSTFIELDYTK